MKQNHERPMVWAITMVFICFFGLSGCSKTVRTIEFPAFFSKRMIEVTLPVIRYDSQADPYEFESKSSLEQIKAFILEWDPEAWVDIRENGIFIASINPESQNWDYYYIYKSSSLNDRIYRISDLRTRYIGELEDNSDYYLDFLLPVHLFKLKGNEEEISFKSGENYEMVSGTTFEDVFYFYGASGYYDTEWGDEQIILWETYFYNQEESDQGRFNYEIQIPVIIKITTNDEKTFFSYTVEEFESNNYNREEDLINYESNEDKEVRPAISWDEALERTLSIVEKSRDEIASCETLYDTDDNPRYEMLTFSSGGYVIHMLDYAVVIEFSGSDQTQYPYEGVTSEKKYYVGPGNNFYEENGHIISSQYNAEVQLETFRDEEALILEYAIRMGNRIAGADEESGNFDTDETEETDKETGENDFEPGAESESEEE